MTDADRATLERILHDYGGLAHRLASSYEADRDAARDLTQEILVAVWRAWPAFRRQCSERTYVARIAHHRIATHVARAVRQPLQAELSDPGRRGEYQGVYQLGYTVGSVWAPAAYTFLAMEWGVQGWLVIAAIVVLAAVGIHPSSRAAERYLARTRQPSRRDSPSPLGGGPP